MKNALRFARLQPVKDPKKPKPPAYQSPLQPHFETIRAWRRARMTWRQIADKLQKEQGIDLTLQAVQSFFKAASKRGGKLPLGFEDPVPKPTAPTDRAQAASAPTAAREERPDYEVPPPPTDGLTPFQRERRKRLDQEQQAQQAQKNNQPK